MGSDRWLLAWALGSVALGATSLLIPLYFVTIGGSTLLLGILAGTAAAAGAPGALLFGRLADRSGTRRSLVLVALALAAAAIVAVSATQSVPVVIAGNAVLWFAAGGAAPVLTLLVTVGSPERDWPGRFAVLNRYQGWGWAGGLVLGLAWTGLLSGPLGVVVAQQTLLLVCAGATTIAAVLAARWLPADPGEAAPQPRPNRIARAITRSRRLPVRSATFPIGPGRLYWLTRSLHPRQLASRLTPSLSLYFVAVVAVFTGFGVFWGPLPSYLAGTLDYGSGVVFALYLLSSLGSALCYGLAGRLAERFDVIGLQTGSLLARAALHPAVAVVGVAVPAAFGVLTNAVVFTGIGAAWAVVAITAASIVTRLAPPAIRGEALGLYTALSGLATGVGSVLGGWLGGYGFTLTFGVAGGCVLVGTALVAVIWRRTPKAEPTAATATESL